MNYFGQEWDDLSGEEKDEKETGDDTAAKDRSWGSVKKLFQRK